MDIAKHMKKEKERTAIFGRLNAATRRAIFSIGILIALFALFAVLQPEKFLASTNLQNLLQQIVTYTIIGCGLTFCLVWRICLCWMRRAASAGWANCPVR